MCKTFGYRFYEWKRYIKFEFFSYKKSDILLVIPTFNNEYNLIKLLNSIYHYCDDILIVDNSTYDSSISVIAERFPKCFLIKTTNNIGGAGAIALAMEWALDKGYDYILLVEDDITLLEPEKIRKFYDLRNISSIITGKYLEFESSAYFFHLTLIPTWIFREIGVVYAPFFIRGDDWEYFQRVNHYLIKSGRIKIETIDVYYSHPLIKGTDKLWFYYFNFRNWINIFLKYPIKSSLFDIFKWTIIHFVLSFLLLIYDRNVGLLKILLVAIYDIIKFDFSRSLERRVDFDSIKNPHRQQVITLEINEFLENYKDHMLISRLKGTKYGSEFNKFSLKLVTQSYNSLYRPVSLLFRDVIFIENFNLVENKVDYISYKVFQPISIIVFLFSLLLSIFFTIPFVTVLFISYLYHLLTRKGV